MSNDAVEMRDLPEAVSANSGDLLVITRNPTANNRQLSKISVLNFSSNSSGMVFKGKIVANVSTPANSTVNVIPGEIFFDNTYAYFAISNNNIKRVLLENF